MQIGPTATTIPMVVGIDPDPAVRYGAALARITDRRNGKWKSRVQGSPERKLSFRPDCACGPCLDADDGEDQFTGRQIEVVSKQLDRLGWRIPRFTSRERDDILANFKSGLIDAMVAIKCLDEGIDVPACGTAYILASSRDPRQFIQRRGRILRHSPGKEHATIHDFVTVRPAGHHDGGARAQAHPV